jgi:hypothetical protein
MPATGPLTSQHKPNTELIPNMYDAADIFRGCQLPRIAERKHFRLEEHMRSASGPSGLYALVTAFRRLFTHRKC